MEWISVKDRFPKNNEECLVAFKYSPNYAYELATYISNFRKFICWTGIRRDVTHWMPLPNPPKK